jgi:hypothetical protein
VPRFLFGLSAAGSRLEGGFNGRGEPANQWTAWERAGKVPAARAGARVWADPDRVLELAAEAGAGALALSVEWARIEPAPGRVDEGAVARYAATFASVAARGITPIAVLHDIAHPAWLGEEFWLTPGSPDRFADHVARLVGPLASSCRHWVTLRQPNLVALAGWVDGRYPPRRFGALADAWAVVDNLLSAHLLAYGAIHDLEPDAQVLLGLRASSSYDWHRLMVDLLCAPALGVERDALDPWIAARRARHEVGSPPSSLGDLAWRRVAAATSPFGAGRFRRPSPRRVVDLAYRLAVERAGRSAASHEPDLFGEPKYLVDALLVGWLPPHLRAALPDLVRPAAAGRMVRPWEVGPDPGALTAWCREHARAVPGLPVWVEDGFPTRGGAPRADGWDRRSYIQAEVRALEPDMLDPDGSGAAPQIAGYLYHAPWGGGDPTWPDADFGLEGDAPGLGRLAEPRR